ncbi:MAG: Rrf2 family transcriptional regulator [Gemmatimonadetes bacterium]|nr:Rrf2 family transcriptional regulator [Gemmatimonadota bacterium]MBP9199115.1 Rrf2 family transcriptional regulator [Gemmatimonadales bacterium]
MVLSQTAEYALRAVLTIAEEPGGQPVGAYRLADALGIPQNYLSKTLHQLARAGILDSTRGKLGGFRLARDPREIPLVEVVGLFDDVTGKRTCLMGRANCTDHNSCAAHRRWKGVSERISEFFRETTVADLVSERRAVRS